MKPKKATLELSTLVSTSFNCLEYTWARPKNNAIKLAKNNPKKLLANFGSKNIIRIPKKDVKIKSHLFLLILKSLIMLNFIFQLWLTEEHLIRD